MRKTLLALLLFCCGLLLLAGCGGGASGGGDAGMNAAPSASGDYRNVSSSYDAEEMADSGGYASVSDMPAVTEARKVVTRAEFFVRTEDFAGAMRSLEHKIAVSGSYIQQSYSSAATEYRGASASMTIRVPSTMYGDFKSFITDLAELISASEQGEDVTVQYYDTEARLKVLQAQAERVRSFIAASKNLEEIFTIERELMRINTEIEQLTTVRNRLDNLIAYATVYVEISDNNSAKIEPATFGARVSNALSGSVDNIIIVAQSILLVVIWCWPFLLLILIAIPVWRKIIKKRIRKEHNNDRI